MAKKPPDRLSIESSKAIAAGMTYGKWKALQSAGLIESTDYEEELVCDTPGLVLMCKYCGEEFTCPNKKGKGGRQYCTKECAQKAYYKLLKERKCANGQA